MHPVSSFLKPVQHNILIKPVSLFPSELPLWLSYDWLQHKLVELFPDDGYALNGRRHGCGGQSEVLPHVVEAVTAVARVGVGAGHGTRCQATWGHVVGQHAPHVVRPLHVSRLWDTRVARVKAYSSKHGFVILRIDNSFQGALIIH